ncbi:Hpt domain-containing protein [Uliginosibacterium sp. 31-16]|uniref:hybrid sensor histidine kinase/response regulator n=1 Tax=Uliginosibacterium sp. 31-16 TaxID=3068315 RepID=UPI00273D4650|nr:Hpt domain-containing protein [Uliginosibacterium sp. 31-16]MDP5239011.1 Hpt domain-containing protein [Uliginosibacterium sp. 31-16]
MSLNNDFDVGPLTWVKGEIDAALNAARDRLTEVQADPSQREPLRFAQSHVHQASGALSIVGLDGVSQFAEAVDKLLSALAANEVAMSPELLALALRSVGMLGNYINEISAGAPHQPLRLFPAYQELVAARGGEAPLPSELFFPDLSVRPQLASTDAIAPERAAHELRVLRGRFEKGLLNWLRKPQEVAGPQEMLSAVQRIEQIQALPATRAFWWASIAFFEGLTAQAIPADRPAQRLCRRIDTQMKRLLEGSQIVAERLVRDVLYFVATARIDSQHADAVRSTYGLDRILPSPDVELSDTLRQPFVLRVRETLEQAKDCWNRFCAGAAVALPQFQEQLLELGKRVEPMRLAQVNRLLVALAESIVWLRADPLRLSDDLSMEIATGLLVIEQAAESPNADPALLRRQVDLLCVQFSGRCRGDVVPELDLTPFGEASRRAQERLFFNQLAREILTNLGQIEQTLDGFFRNPAQRDALPGLAGPLKQIEGAFAVLGEQKAVTLVRDNAAAIARFAEATDAPAQEELDEVAHQLSALGFYVDALKTGAARLDDFLNPSSTRIDEEVVAAATTTVEAQLQRETRETHNLVEALKEAPEDQFLRDQLVSSLEAIREDAQLVADTGLEQKAKDALASLKSGEATQETLAETFASVVPALAPQPSEETARLMAASNEELDAELLGIFLEEAHEVLETIAEHRNKVVAEPHDFESLTTVRRGFHTLKGSSRMVGLTDFSEAARFVEMAMNRWLQLEKDADASLIAMLDNACLLFGAWVEQLETGGGLWRDATALTAQAQNLLGALDSPADEMNTPAAAVGAAASVAGAVAEPVFTDELQEAMAPAVEAGSELDLTSTLMELDLAALSSGEQIHTEVDLAVTDFEGDALRIFTSEFGEQAGGAEAEALAARFEAPQTPSSLDPVATAPDLLDFELDDLDAEVEAPPAASPAAAATGDVPVALDLDFGDDDIDTSSPAEPVAMEVAELDLTSSMVNTQLEAMMNGDSLGETEMDLTATDLAGIMPAEASHAAAPLTLDEPLIDELEIGLPLLAEEAPVLAVEAETGAGIELLPEEDVPTLDEELVAQEPELPEVLQPEESIPDLPELEPVPEAALEPVFGTSTLTRKEDVDGIEEVAIDDDEGDIELPVINLNAFNPPSVQAVPEPAMSESEVTIGDQTLSRGLYDLYIAESRQLLDKLLDEHTRLETSSLRVPTIDAIRAAHTLAGISGTARIESAYALGKALEHALHRFTDTEIPPVAAQTDVLGTAVLMLDGMLAEVVHHIMPLPAPELIAQLEALHPNYPDHDVVPAAAEAPAPAFVDEHVSLVAAATAAAAVPVIQPVPEAPLPLEADSGPQDELDEQLLPIFFEEADELLVAIGGVLRDMRADPADNAPQQSLARQLHTLKGSARMAGAMRLGQYVHNLETHLEASALAHHAGPALVDDLENGLDHIGALVAALKNPPELVPEAGVPESEEALQTATVADVPGGLLETPAAPASAAVPVRQVEAMPVFDDLDATQTQPRAPLRVKAEMIDRFVNEAGEVSIARTRIEGEMRVLRRSLLDLTENVIRLRNQLREVEIQAESQMQSRIAAAESMHDNFDPLEFDRFTRLQELTRMMAESVGDVTTIQQNLLRNLDAADSALHAQGRLSRDLQQALMGVRMVPFEELADRLYRVVRQTTKELGKRANLDIVGGAIEIDRGVLDRMTAPIEHLLRNAIAHGIEMPEIRAAAGKPEVGQITLKLTQLSNEIALELADDGKGLDYARILARGRSVGLVGPDENPNENRLTQLIFEPGFSTAESVSGIAGRGVGMDVVKNETMSVGGRIDIFSDVGKGSRFLIHLPLTLAVTQALLVRSGERTYAIPSNMVEQALELKDSTLQEVRSKGLVEWKETQYPFTYLPRLLGNVHAQPLPARYQWVLLVRAGSQTLAVHIDELRGNQEIVVKNAGPQFVRLQGYSGATVLADGEISLILNPVALAARQSVSAAASGDVAEAGEEGYTLPVETRIPSIMVVDDSLTVRKITSRMLEREGFQVVTAKDGVDALEQLVEYKPDVMLLDIEMPRMDGFDLARNVRADARLKDVPIIMITSRMADKHRNYAMEIGVNNYLGKPYQEEQLLELIAGFIAAQRT